MINHLRATTGSNQESIASIIRHFKRPAYCPGTIKSDETNTQEIRRLESRDFLTGKIT